MKIKMNKYTAAGIVFVVSAALFFLLTMPFRVWMSAAEITDMRPVTALTPILGMIFGFPAALGCAAGNIVTDLISGYEFTYAVISAVQQIIYALVPFILWKKLNKEDDGSEFSLDSVSRLLKLLLIMFIDALLIVICTGIVNQAYSVSDFFSINSLYLFTKSFDSGLMFGCPLLIVGHFLQNYLNNLKNNCRDKVIILSLNERMIINTIISGVGISLLMGISVYITDKMSGAEKAIGIGGRIYLFQTIAFNFYFALSMGFMWFTERHISKPVEKLAEVAHSYYVEHSEHEDRNKLLKVGKEYVNESTEVGDLARSYISMVEDIDGYVSNIQKITAEKERINAELSLASSIQAHMLPFVFPAFPEHDEFDIYASMTPAKEVGGDFYDLFMMGEDRLAVVMADVSGKGVPAALFMVIAKTLIKNHAQNNLEPCEVFTTVNRLLCEGNDVGLFVTAWMGILDLSTHKLTYVNAGHNPPLLKHGTDKFEYLKSRPGFVLAGMETMKYRQNEMILESGDRLFLYTDGVTEAANKDNRLYGEERLAAFLNSHISEPASGLLPILKQDIDDFALDVPQSDDITMLILDIR